LLVSVPPQTARQQGEKRFLADVAAGLRYVAGHRLLAVLMPVSAVISFTFMGLLNVGLTLLAYEAGWGAGGLGVLLGAFGAGAMLGAAVHGFRLIRRPFTAGMALAGMALQAVLLLLTAMSPSLVLAVALQVGIGVLTSLTGAPLVTLVQAAATPDMLGRTMSLHSLAMIGFTPLAYAAAGLVGSRFGVLALFAGGSAVQAIAGLGGLASATVRRATPEGLREMQEPLAATSPGAQPSSEGR
jgi:predicted MFS family arabinose efflux permease